MVEMKRMEIFHVCALFRKRVDNRSFSWSVFPLSERAAFGLALAGEKGKPLSGNPAIGLVQEVTQPPALQFVCHHPIGVRIQKQAW